MRPETGTMKFGDDWRGVFIRGDNAFAIRLALDRTLKLLVDENKKTTLDYIATIPQLEGFLKLLEQSDERNEIKTHQHQQLKPFNECI
jgi:hypothetical protein